MPSFCSLETCKEEIEFLCLERLNFILFLPPISNTKVSLKRSSAHMSVRKAVRAGTWYDGDASRLGRYIEKSLSQAEELIAQETGNSDSARNADGKQVLGIIGPHAGLSYCGATSACAYSRLKDFLYRDTANGRVEGDAVERIFLIGPSHAKYFRGVQFPETSAIETPFGNLRVDTSFQKSVESACKSTGCPTGWMTKKEDEAEHSLELHTPFLSNILMTPPAGKRALSDIQIVPIVVGDMDAELESAFGAALRSFLPKSPSESAANLFCISSDFCHWGSRFRYTHRYDPSTPTIGDSIEKMDRDAMKIIEANDCKAWQSYLRKTENTICGRHAIASFMYATQPEQVGGAPAAKAEFVHYSQSSRVTAPDDSSVSYAAAVLTRQ